jgi:hypothetical protein
VVFHEREELLGALVGDARGVDELRLSRNASAPRGSDT